MSFAQAAVVPRHEEPSVDHERELALARAFGAAAVAAWWRGVAPGGPALREPAVGFGATRPPDWMAAEAEALGKSAARLDPEQAAYEIGRAYATRLPAAYRSVNGVFYTPPPLAGRLTEQATAQGVDWQRARVLDPACGSGAFLVPAARRMIEAAGRAGPARIVREIGERLRGLELDPFAAWLSQIALDAIVLPLTRAGGGRLPDVVDVCNALRRGECGGGFDLVIGNPPYGRVKLNPAERDDFAESLYGHANLYGLFTHVALRLARPGGVVAFVTPTSFLAGQYFKALRSLLAARAPPASIDLMDARKGIFDNVLQETLLAVYRRGGNRARVQVNHLVCLDDGRIGCSPCGAAALPDDPSLPWLLPRRDGQARLVARMAAMPDRLADWGYVVSTGPLVWNRHKAQLAAGPGPDRFPLVWAEAVTTDGRFVHRAEKRGHSPWFQVRTGDHWLKIDRPCVLLQRTTAKEQARRLIAAALPAEFIARHGAAVVENHLNMLRPLTPHPAVAAPVLAAFLNSRAADDAFRCLSGSVAVSAYELEALPLPPPEALTEVARLVARGSDARAIDAACARLYVRDG